jgi:pSer/pThr/pTyr-binding forkhead associated (FHA) protein
MKLRLLVAEGVHKGKVIPIPGPKFMIGRHRQCQLRAVSPKISLHHCALLVRDGTVWVRDFDSTNGTYINDEQVRGERELHDGDHLRIDPLAFRVSIDLTQDADPAPATPPGTKPAKRKRLDESAIAAMLLGETRDDESVDLFAVEDEGEYGSTVMHSPVAPPASPEPPAGPGR